MNTTIDGRAPASRVTRNVLLFGVLAGPFYVVVALVQGLLRPGFDLTRHDVSLLSNGSWGWIQIANFLITGAMVIAFAVGLARAQGSTWAPRLLVVYGIGLLGAGIFVADPMNGFPPGAPAGHPTTVSVHGILHIVFAGIGFLCLIAACIVMSRRFMAERRRGWAIYSVVAGVAFLAAFGGIASGSASPVVVLAFWAALILVWSWMAAVAAHYYSGIGGK